MPIAKDFDKPKIEGIFILFSLFYGKAIKSHLKDYYFDFFVVVVDQIELLNMMMTYQFANIEPRNSIMM